MSQLHVEAEGVTGADPEVVWALVADANSYSSWGPWSDGGYQPASEGPSRKGSVQWFRYGRRTTSVEEILEADESRRLVYTVVRGLPVRNYRAEVTLTPMSPKGTSVRWTATWDGTFMGRMVRRRLQQVYRQVMTALIAAADHEAVPGRRK
ncbi:MAG TPA: SRPBCC family protein [Streptosporangiaceae bacterium]|nr:SRPBCC family protein [Streptosporangiaceae bacterium]